MTSNLTTTDIGERIGSSGMDDGGADVTRPNVRLPTGDITGPVPALSETSRIRRLFGLLRSQRGEVVGDYRVIDGTR